MTTPLLLKVTKFHKAHKVTYVQQKVGTCIEKYVTNLSVLIFTFYLKVVTLHIFAIWFIKYIYPNPQAWTSIPNQMHNLYCEPNVLWQQQHEQIQFDLNMYLIRGY